MATLGALPDVIEKCLNHIEESKMKRIYQRAQYEGPMLTAYCNHVTRAAQIEAALATLEPLTDLNEFDKLSKLAAGESAKIAMHARAMRLTQQSRLKAETASSRGLGAASAAIASKKSREGAGVSKYYDDLIMR
jgi:hypothetical protein